MRRYTVKASIVYIHLIVYISFPSSHFYLLFFPTSYLFLLLRKCDRHRLHRLHQLWLTFFIPRWDQTALGLVAFFKWILVHLVPKPMDSFGDIRNQVGCCCPNRQKVELIRRDRMKWKKKKEIEGKKHNNLLQRRNGGLCSGGKSTNTTRQRSRVNQKWTHKLVWLDLTTHNTSQSIMAFVARQHYKWF